MRLVDVVFVYHLRDPRQIAWHGRDHDHGPGLYELHYFVAGAGSFRNGSSLRSIGSGSLHLTPPGLRHQILATEAGNPITYYALLVDASGDPDLAELLDCLCAAAPARNVGQGYRFFFADLLEKRSSGDPALENSARHALFAFLYELASGKGPSLGACDNVHVEKALAIMQARIGKGLDLDVLASKLGLSREHFCRLFSSRMGIPPMRYFAKLTAEAARAMLSSTGLRIGEISARLGYENQFSFCRAFKRATGMHPTEYRAKALQKVDFGLG